MDPRMSSERRPVRHGRGAVVGAPDQRRLQRVGGSSMRTAIFTPRRLLSTEAGTRATPGRRPGSESPSRCGMTRSGSGVEPPSPAKSTMKSWRRGARVTREHQELLRPPTRQRVWTPPRRAGAHPHNTGWLAPNRQVGALADSLRAERDGDVDLARKQRLWHLRVPHLFRTQLDVRVVGPKRLPELRQDFQARAPAEATLTLPSSPAAVRFASDSACRARSASAAPRRGKA